MEENTQNPKKQGQYGTGSQGTQEREDNITGSMGVQNRQGQNINQGSTTGVKGGQGLGQPNQQRPGNLGQQKKPDRPTGFGAADEAEEEE